MVINYVMGGVTVIILIIANMNKSWQTVQIILKIVIKIVST